MSNASDDSEDYIEDNSKFLEIQQSQNRVLGYLIDLEKNVDKDRNTIYQNIQEILGELRGNDSNVDTGVSLPGGSEGSKRGRPFAFRSNRRGIRLNSNGTSRASIEEIRATLISGFRRSNIRHRIVHTIYERTIPHERSDDQIIGDIQRTFHGTIFIIGYHGNHYHVIHDCNWSSASCRCARIRCIEQGRHGDRRHRYNRKITSASSWTIDHWINLLIYLDTAERGLMSIEISGDEWLRNHRGKFSTLFQGSGFRLERSLEGIRLSDEDCSASANSPYSYPGNEIDTEYHGQFEEAEGRQEDDVSTQGTSQQRGGRSWSVASTSEGKKKDTLLDYFKSIIFSPPKALFSSRLWLKSKFRYTDKRKTYFNITYEELKLFYAEKSVTDIWMHFMSCDPLQIFFASENPGEYYYDIRTSVQYLEALLNFQFDDCERSVKTFLRDIRDILDRRRAKCNTLFILGEANAGKNFFFDCVTHFTVNFGIIANWNRHNQFPLQDCVNRRLLIWNEPNFEDGVEETLKMLFGGDQCPARVKYEGDAVIQRTPIIILSNNDCFPRSQAFRTRMIRYRWRACRYLRDLTKKPHPLAIAYLFARWNIINWKDLEYEFSENELAIFNDVSLS